MSQAQRGILRAKVLSFDASNHQADVAPLETPDSVLGGVPVLESCPGDLLAMGDVALVQRFADGCPKCAATPCTCA